MNLRNNNITVGELMKNPQAKQLLQRELPEYMSGSLLALAQGMTLNTVIGFSSGRVPREKIARLIAELEKI